MQIDQINKAELLRLIQAGLNEGNPFQIDRTVYCIILESEDNPRRIVKVELPP